MVEIDVSDDRKKVVINIELWALSAVMESDNWLEEIRKRCYEIAVKNVNNWITDVELEKWIKDLSGFAGLYHWITFKVILTSKLLIFSGSPKNPQWVKPAHRSPIFWGSKIQTVKNHEVRPNAKSLPGAPAPACGPDPTLPTSKKLSNVPLRATKEKLISTLRPQPGV